MSAANFTTNFSKPELKRDPSSHQEPRKGRAAKKNAASINHLLDFQLYRDLPEYRQQHLYDGGSNSHRGRNNNRNYQNKNRNSNYLLNLNYDYDGYGSGSGSGASSGRGRAPRRKQKAYLHGMRFINVNYKFIVDYRKSYGAQKLDPNVPVDTDDILCIVAPQGNACPICLSSELVAPRMITSCGHILCLPCLLALLDSEVPTSMKREGKAIVEKYTDCPLCASVIRRSDVKPVLVDTTDVRFDMPKVNDEIVLTLMAREANKIVPVPKYTLDEVSEESSKKHSAGFGQFPWADQLYTHPYLRIYKGDHTYVTGMYEREKEALREAYEKDSDLFLAGGKLLKLALLSIDGDLRSWKDKFESEQKNAENLAAQKPVSASKSNYSDSSRLLDSSKSSDSPKTSFFYYQTGFKCPATYVLSALDMKLLKNSYGSDYSQLPPSIVAKVESIRYEEMDEELATTRYKYISHLPLGTLIGFLECNWEHNEYISGAVWTEFKQELLKRTKNSLRKITKEEKSRQRALNEEERRAREYIENENNGGSRHSDEDNSWLQSAGIGSLTITDYREMPTLSGDSPLESRSLSADGAEPTQRSVWGTQIPKAEVTDGNPEDAWDADEMIRRAREEIEKQELNGKGKTGKKKKKYILLLSNSGWA